MQAQRGAGGGGPGPRGVAGGVGGLLLLGGGAILFNNALFNVDGGHRAIKYTRLGGVGKEIYSEGMDLTFIAISSQPLLTGITLQEPISRSHGSRPQ
jgi:hypothetical protein